MSFLKVDDSSWPRTRAHVPVDVTGLYDHAVSPALVNQENDIIFGPIEDPFSVPELSKNPLSKPQGFALLNADKT